MTFSGLRDFITNMRMSHIYQPFILGELLRNAGHLSNRELASKLASLDTAQIAYYESILKVHPRNTLVKVHKVLSMDQGEWSIPNFDKLSTEEISELVSLCSAKLEAAWVQHGDRIFSLRSLTRRYVPGSVRYEVLKRAKWRCELCGCSVEVRPLDVDHIVPVTRGGRNDLSNYQALCSTCNQNKGNRDASDFRTGRDFYEIRDKACHLCEAGISRKLIGSNQLAIAFGDKYEVTRGHSLVIPKRHVASFSELTVGEIQQMNLLVKQVQKTLAKDNKIAGFNIGINDGEAAGQTIPHVHMHVIPRRVGDHPQPRGGIRNLLGETNY
jgi:ATP adenylyltransferase